MSNARRGPRGRVWIAGATGLIGSELVRQCLADDAQVHALVRRAPATAGAQAALHWHVVDFAQLAALPGATAGDTAYCALGTTIKVAGSQAAFRAVDFDAVLAFARAARAAGVQRLAVVSALGADTRSPGFYSRVKGEMEQALRELAFDKLIIARPSLLAGDRATLGQPARSGERLALALTRPLSALIPKAWRPVEAATVARAMRVALKDLPEGTHVLGSGRLQELGA